jgi:hypothetical protein
VTKAARPAAESSKAVTRLPISTKAKREHLIPPLELEPEPSDNEVTIPATSGDGLPIFTRSCWSTRFIPTLTNCLASTLDPWDIGNGADIIVVFQGVVDKVYPGLGYQVKFGDKIYTMVQLLIRFYKT